MRSRFMTAVSSLLLLAASAGVLFAAGDGAWEPAAQENGIDVYTRPVAGSGIKEFKGSIEIDADIPKVLALLQDADDYTNWFPNCIESKELPPVEDAALRYSVSDAPWPISDRDMILRALMLRDEKTGTVVVNVAAAPDAYPLQEGLVRIREATGSWTLEPIGSDKTRITFQMHLEPGGELPEWLINARVVDTPLTALANIRTSLTATQ